MSAQEFLCRRQTKAGAVGSTGYERIEDRILQILSGSLPSAARRSLNADSNLRALGLDSLAVILAVTKFCEEFSIDAGSLEGSIANLSTVGDLIRVGKAIVDSQKGVSEV